MPTTDSPRSPQLVLVMGADGAGKSTALQQLASIGYQTLEPTTTPEALAWRQRHYNDPLNLDLIQERRRLFLKLNRQFNQQIAGLLAQGQPVATTNHELVTELYHEVMHGVIDGSYTPQFSLHDWLSHATLHPTQLLMLHAPIQIIEQRLTARADANPGEALIGFNSLTFLEAFQRTLLSLRQPLQTLGIANAAFDTSVMSPTAIIEHLASATASQTV